MDTHICSTCQKSKPLYEFVKDNKRYDGYSFECKECKRIRTRAAYHRDINKSREYYKQKVRRKLEQYRKQRRKWYAQQSQAYKDKRQEYQKEWGKTERGKQSNYLKVKKWASKNIDKVRATRRRSYYRYRTNSEFKLNRLGRAIYKSLGRKKAGYHWEKIVGYTLEDLKRHLESLFQPGMTWENYGFWGWHIDHIKPVCSFNYQDFNDSQFQECWGLNNLRPLWAKDNLRKGRLDKLQSVKLYEKI